MIGEQPVQGSVDVREASRAVRVEHLEGHDAGIGRDTRPRNHPGRRDDSADARPMAVVVLGAARSALRLRAVRAAAAEGTVSALTPAALGDEIVGQVGMIGVDPGIDHRHRDAVARDAHGVGHIGARERPALGEARVRPPVHVDVRHGRMPGERLDGSRPGPAGEAGEVLVATPDAQDARRQVVENALLTGSDRASPGRGGAAIRQVGLVEHHRDADLLRAVEAVEPGAQLRAELLHRCLPLRLTDRWSEPQERGDAQNGNRPATRGQRRLVFGAAEEREHQHPFSHVRGHLRRPIERASRPPGRGPTADRRIRDVSGSPAYRGLFRPAPRRPRRSS